VFVALGKLIAVAFQIFAVSFEILDHQVFATQLVEIGEVVDELILRETDARIG
jgi:hypothetical protein